MTRLVIGLLRPYRGWLAIVFIAMLAEIAASLAAPWPLKLVLDDALGKHHLPHWLEWAHDYGFGRHTPGVALFAGVATLVIAVIGAIATYIDNYYTTSVRRADVDHYQRRGHDLELCLVFHAEHHRGHHYHRFNDRLHVLAGLGLHPHCPCNHAVPSLRSCISKERCATAKRKDFNLEWVPSK